MKLVRSQVLAVIEYCRERGVNYSNIASYPNVLAAARRRDERSPSGLLLHFPQDISQGGRIQVRSPTPFFNKRAYVIWMGEPLEAVAEALAFIAMTTNRSDLFVLRCVKDVETSPAALREEYKGMYGISVHPAEEQL